MDRPGSETYTFTIQLFESFWRLFRETIIPGTSMSAAQLVIFVAFLSLFLRLFRRIMGVNKDE